MIRNEWERIAGIHVQDDGQIAAVWLAWDKETDCIHLYDCHIHNRDVIAVQAKTLRQKGQWIPIAWHTDASEIVDLLVEDGCNTLHEGVRNSDPIAEAVSLDIWERMRTGRFKVSREAKPWLDEFETYQRRDMKVPRDTHPLMAATRHAVAQIKYGKAKPGRNTKNYPELAVI